MNPEHRARFPAWLDAAAARGEFRWLIDPDSIDFDDCMVNHLKRKVIEEKE